MAVPLSDIFQAQRPLIGMIHLLPLPGAPRWGGAMDAVLERAVRDAKALETAGLDGLLGMEERHRARVVGVGVVAHDARHRRRVAIARAQDHGAGLRRGEAPAVPGVGEEGDVLGPGRIQGRHAREAPADVAHGLAAKLRHDLTEGQSARGHGVTGRRAP